MAVTRYYGGAELVLGKGGEGGEGGGRIFFFQAEDGIRDHCVTGQTCALPISEDNENAQYGHGRA